MRQNQVYAYAGIVLWGLFGSGGPAFAADAADATAAAGAPAAGPGVKSDQELQEIVVTGLRASLVKSLEVKRNATVVLDSINAEELGRFPDADVADSLQHLPGITIDRTTGGEGHKVSVRGFTSQYNIVTLNNRILATDDDARDLAFDVLPSELISGADVLKSSEASALEGSIGGTVNLAARICATAGPSAPNHSGPGSLMLSAVSATPAASIVASLASTSR